MSTLLDDVTADGAAEPDTEAQAAAARVVRLPGPRELYDRWELQQWSVAKLDVSRDAERFAALRPFARAELLGALAELEIGEVCVTRTLSSLVDHAPAEADRIYLCTQMADEGRHVQFFQRYLYEAAAVDEADLAASGSLGRDSAYGNIFEPVLIAATENVRARAGEREAWFAALVQYHLLTEGVLAASGLRVLRALAKSCGLDALNEGLTNVARDETRHLTYGLAAARTGVESGYADIIGETYLGGLATAVEVLVNPERKTTAPVLRPALAARAAQIQFQWTVAYERMVKQLNLVGLHRLRDRADQAWQDAFDQVFARYRETWGADHPVPRARKLGLLDPVGSDH
jgi:ribonucleoside-diphosphate reductase beta chain